MIKFALSAPPRLFGAVGRGWTLAGLPRDRLDPTGAHHGYKLSSAIRL
jgi:hypothetical protein